MIDIPFRNKTTEEFRIAVEPIAQAFDIPAQSEAVIRIKEEGHSLEIDVWADNFIAIWVASEFEILHNGIRLDPVQDY